MQRADIFRAIDIERERQEQLHPIPKENPHDEPDVKAVKQLFFMNEMLSVLVEEMGEVGKAMQGDGELEEELIQVAAVCCRWLENMK